MLRNPHALAAAYIRRSGYRARGHQLDELYADALAAIGEAAVSWRPDGGRSFASWAWLVMDHRVPRMAARQHRWRMELAVDAPDAFLPWRPDEDEDPRRMRICTIEPGYAQVEDRDELERIARWAALTPAEADMAEWFAVHGGTIVRHLGGPERWWPGVDVRGGALNGARRKLRAAAKARSEWFEHRQAEPAA